MTNIRNEIVIGLLAIAAIAGTVVLACLHHPVPAFLPLLAVSGLSALAGITLPGVAAGGTITGAGLSSDAAAIISALGGKLDTLLTRVIGAPDAGVLTGVATSTATELADTAANTIAGDLAQGSPLPPAQPATNPATDTAPADTAPAAPAAVPPAAPAASAAS